MKPKLFRATFQALQELCRILKRQILGEESLGRQKVVVHLHLCICLSGHLSRVGLVFGWVLDRSQSVRPHSVLVFSLRQQSPCPVPVLQTGGGVEWDRRAASTNLFPSAVWLMSLVGVQLLPASGMYPPHPSEEVFLGCFFSAFPWDGQCGSLAWAVTRFNAADKKGVAGWLVGRVDGFVT